MPAPEDRYWSLIDSCILHLEPTCSSLAELCRLLPGLYPTDVLQRLDHLRASELLASADHERLRGYRQEDGVPESRNSVLPLPHPLDYEWRFTAASAADMFERVRGLEAKRTALLGTPFLAECANSDDDSAFELFERRVEACLPISSLGRVTVHCVDLATADDSAPSFDAVIADPPWYPAAIDIFMNAASRLLKAGGAFMMSSPALGTRPSIAAERMRATEFADRNGLVVVELAKAALRYESPPFELSALRAAGLSGLPFDWRCGDLFTFVKNGSSEVFAADVDISAAESWDEVTIGPARIRVRRDARDTGPPLSRVVDGDVLDSVSRRDERRRQANVMTTANCVYRTADPALLLASLQELREEVEDLVDTVAPRDPESVTTYAEAAGFVARGDVERLAYFGLA